MKNSSTSPRATFPENGVEHPACCRRILAAFRTGVFLVEIASEISDTKKRILK